MLILPDRPAEGSPCVVHLAATGDHGYTRRTHLGLPLVQQVGGSAAGGGAPACIRGGKGPLAQALAPACLFAFLYLLNAEPFCTPSPSEAQAADCASRAPRPAVPAAQGIATLALESPYYGERKPHYQQVGAALPIWTQQICCSSTHLIGLRFPAQQQLERAMAGSFAAQLFLLLQPAVGCWAGCAYALLHGSLIRICSG